MRFTFDQAVTFFHQRLAFAARRWAFGVNAPVDMYQELLIALTAADFRELAGDARQWCQHRKCLVNYDPTHVNAFIDSRAKDLLRKEQLRQSVKHITTEALDRRSRTHDEPELRVDLTAALASMPAQRRAAVLLLASPDERVMALALADQAEAKADAGSSNRLRMNIKRPRVTMLHVAKVLGVSKATVSREIALARRDLLAFA